LYSCCLQRCTGTEFPETSVEMSPVNIECSTFTAQQAVARLRLGVQCGDSNSTARYYDPYVECADGNSFHMPLPKPFEDREFDIYICHTTVDFAVQSPRVRAMEPVGAFTDFRWSMLADPSCYSFVAGPTDPPTKSPTRSPTTRPTFQPTLSPTRRPTLESAPPMTTRPTDLRPSQSPTSVPSMESTFVPTKSPTSTEPSSLPARLLPTPSLGPKISSSDSPTILPTVTQTSACASRSLFVFSCFGVLLAFVAASESSCSMGPL